MLTKRVAVYLLASVFSVAVHVPHAVSQQTDVNCDKQDASPDLRGKCDENVKLNRLDPTVTNSTTQGDDESKANANNPGGADTNSADGDGDHDNGHGNDADHDDSSNPGNGGGNHGTGNNGGGKGKGK